MRTRPARASRTAPRWRRRRAAAAGETAGLVGVAVGDRRRTDAQRRGAHRAVSRADQGRGVSGRGSLAGEFDGVVDQVQAGRQRFRCAESEVHVAGEPGGRRGEPGEEFAWLFGVLLREGQETGAQPPHEGDAPHPGLRHVADDQGGAGAGQGITSHQALPMSWRWPPAVCTVRVYGLLRLSDHPHGSGQVFLGERLLLAGAVESGRSSRRPSAISACAPAGATFRSTMPDSHQSSSPPRRATCGRWSARARANGPPYGQPSRPPTGNATGVRAPSCRPRSATGRSAPLPPTRASSAGWSPGRSASPAEGMSHRFPRRRPASPYFPATRPGRTR